MRGFFVQVRNFLFFDDLFISKDTEIGQICCYKLLRYIGVFHHLIVPMPRK
jgi:hypothetical protein